MMIDNIETDHPKYQPVGDMIDVGGFRMHLHSMGSGAPTVVMEAAIWDIGLTWSLVQPGVAAFTRAVVYDRAGLGWSDASPNPRTASVMVAERRRLLAGAGISPPYVLVGQSFASLLVLLEAFQHTGEVAGIVLVDGAHEDQDQRFPNQIDFTSIKEMQLGYLQQVRDQIASQGSAAVASPLSLPPQMPEATIELYNHMMVADHTRIETMIAELESIEESRAEVRAARILSLGNLPLFVLSHGKPQPVPGMDDEVNQEYEQTWQKIQREHAALSSNSRLETAADSGHMIHYEQPTLVIDAIHQVVEASRGGKQL
jgi:pimeloyl-ACP methyl ester carboxylesterase